MALTFTEVHRERARGADTLKHNIYEITLDGSYPQAGYAITAANVGMDVRIKHAHFHSQELGSMYVLGWDRTNGKLQIGVGYTAAGAGGGPVNANLSALNGLKVIGHFYGT